MICEFIDFRVLWYRGLPPRRRSKEIGVLMCFHCGCVKIVGRVATCSNIIRLDSRKICVGAICDIVWVGFSCTTQHRYLSSAVCGYAAAGVGVDRHWRCSLRPPCLAEGSVSKSQSKQKKSAPIGLRWPAHSGQRVMVSLLSRFECFHFFYHRRYIRSNCHRFLRSFQIGCCRLVDQHALGFDSQKKSLWGSSTSPLSACYGGRMAENGVGLPSKTGLESISQLRKKRNCQDQDLQDWRIFGSVVSLSGWYVLREVGLSFHCVRSSGDARADIQTCKPARLQDCNVSIPFKREGTFRRSGTRACE